MFSIVFRMRVGQVSSIAIENQKANNATDAFMQEYILYRFTRALTIWETRERLNKELKLWKYNR